MEVKFTKMHGLGNDFVVIDAVNQQVSLTLEQVRHLADRHRGVGCDQVLIVAPPTVDGVDFRYRIYNRNGAEVEQCGNGARCFARFVHEKGLCNKPDIVVQTNSGTIVLYMEADGQVRVDMGKPVFDPDLIPLIAEIHKDRYELNLEQEGLPQAVTVGAVSMGNPHAVMLVDDVDTAEVSTIGKAVENHKRFPNRVNVGFMQVVDRKTIRLRVFERGVGETQACGTGACAAVVIGRKWGLLDETVSVSLPGGELSIQWGFEEKPVWMTGPAESVYEGRIVL